ncbi:hypothetical protein [Paracnuella aquatica]|uniref:hypothetical protein n=1 Tax=Paracnuella aquatica TaxID=2268757 RepID=UPI000DEFE0F3|nr:hypothetical protein [Paracnuella aquatica]RPD48110.1 hypothetical protein DRJ53_10185 [Paracnuella aquatica]
MKKSILSILIFVIFSVALTSCATVNRSKTADYDYMFISKQGIIQRPLVTDLEVAKEKQKLARTYVNVTVAQAKENIMGDFIEQFKCDLIVQPYFTTSTEGTSVKTTVNITVNGYPASYKNIRMYEPKDSANFKIRAFVNNEQNKPITNESSELTPQKKRSVVGTVLGVLGTAALVIVVAALAGA